MVDTLGVAETLACPRENCVITCVLGQSLYAMLSNVMVLNMNPHPLPYFISASSDGSGKTE